MAGLVPSDSVSQSWTTFTNAREWAGLSSEDWLKVATAVGDPTLDSLLLVASLPVDAVREFLANESLGLSLLSKSKVALAINAVRVAHLQGVADFLNPNPVETPTSETRAPSSQPVGSTGLKIKLRQVIDQASDQEVMVLPASEIILARRRYKELGGEAPLVKAEVTDAQLSALAFRMRLHSVRGLRSVGPPRRENRETLKVRSVPDDAGRGHAFARDAWRGVLVYLA